VKEAGRKAAVFARPDSDADTVYFDQQAAAQNDKAFSARRMLVRLLRLAHPACGRIVVPDLKLLGLKSKVIWRSIPRQQG
jgi:hypothetical protein